MPVNIRGIYFTLDEAAEELGLAVDSLRRYCNSKPQKIAGEKVGHNWLIPKSEVDRYKRERNDVGRPASA